MIKRKRFKDIYLHVYAQIFIVNVGFETLLADVMDSMEKKKFYYENVWWYTIVLTWEDSYYF